MLPENVEFNRLLSTSNSLRGSKSTVCLRETLTLIINLFDNDFLNTVNDFLDTVKNPHIPTSKSFNYEFIRALDIWKTSNIAAIMIDML